MLKISVAFIVLFGISVYGILASARTIRTLWRGGWYEKFNAALGGFMVGILAILALDSAIAVPAFGWYVLSGHPIWRGVALTYWASAAVLSILLCWDAWQYPYCEQCGDNFLPFHLHPHRTSHH